MEKPMKSAELCTTYTQEHPDTL